MPNGRARSQRTRHANNRRNTRRDREVGSESNPIIACPVYPDIEATPPTSPVEVVTQADQVDGLNEQIRDLVRINEGLKTKLKEEVKSGKAIALERKQWLGRYNYLKLAMAELGEEMEELGYGELQGLEIMLDSDFEPKKNAYGRYSHPFHLNFATRGKDCKDTAKMNAVWGSGHKDETGLHLMPLMVAKQRAKEQGIDCHIMTLQELQKDLNATMEVADKFEKENITLRKIARNELKAQEFEERNKMKSFYKGKEVETQTDEMCFYDTDMAGWSGF